MRCLRKWNTIEKRRVVLERGSGEADIDWKRSPSTMRDPVSSQFQGHRRKEDFT
ncbi:hypothetical protein CY34DRAFT_804134 [Suillus luteus UH-Slu-Lm8-n1]|uniref:Uncharacterized protein n=1 Tax=Suillus luteus UH-Slu-Lm8-n1 TaxID=930992 RepID=A0A0D0B9V4_9AGAM|nr:hypothetical protein CY34DRAFT_804134 [Suillus luteus UH-Slu-Lm8-n1]